MKMCLFGNKAWNGWKRNKSLGCFCSFWNLCIFVQKTQQALFMKHFTPTTTSMQACSFGSHEGNYCCTLGFPTHWITCLYLINAPRWLLSGISPRISALNWEQPFLWFPTNSWIFPVKKQILESECVFAFTWSKSWILRAEFPAYDPMLKWEPNVCLRFSLPRVRCLFWLGWNVSGQCQPAPRRWRGAFSLALSGLSATS